MAHSRGRAARATTSRDVEAVVGGLRRVVRALEIYSRDVQQRFGLTGPQLWAVKTQQRAGALPVSGLADALAVHQTSASILVARLEQRGLVRRARSPADRRVVLLSLTAAGERLAARAPEAAQGRLLHGLRRLRPSEVRSLRRAVDRIVALMEAEDVRATFFFAE